MLLWFRVTSSNIVFLLIVYGIVGSDMRPHNNKCTHGSPAPDDSEDQMILAQDDKGNDEEYPLDPEYQHDIKVKPYRLLDKHKTSEKDSNPQDRRKVRKKFRLWKPVKLMRKDMLVTKPHDNTVESEDSEDNVESLGGKNPTEMKKASVQPVQLERHLKLSSIKDTVQSESTEKNTTDVMITDKLGTHQSKSLKANVPFKFEMKLPSIEQTRYPSGELKQSEHEGLSCNTPNIDRYYQRAKLKLAHNKTVKSDKDPRHHANPNLRNMLLSLKYASPKTSSYQTISSRPEKSFGNIFSDNMFNADIPTSIFTAEPPGNMLNGTPTVKVLVFGSTHEDITSRDYFLLTLSLMIAMMFFLYLGIQKYCRHTKDTELEYLFKKVAFDSESWSKDNAPFPPSGEIKLRNVEDSSYESYGSFEGDHDSDIEKSTHTTLNLANDQVDLSNITLCKNCHLYRFKPG